MNINGASCSDVSTNGSTISCTTGANPPNKKPSLIVSVNNSVAVNNGVVFYYGYLWSRASTWGGDFAPISGDFVSVGAGKTLIVD